jgi:hypothetical protein
MMNQEKNWLKSDDRRMGELLGYNKKDIETYLMNNSRKDGQ